MNEHLEKRELASFEQEQNFLRHITTLSTGSILILATFIEKIFSEPECKGLMGFIIGLFALSIFCSVIINLHSVILVNKLEKPKKSKLILIYEATIMFGSIGGFLAATTCLGVFIVINL